MLSSILLLTIKRGVLKRDQHFLQDDPAGVKWAAPGCDTFVTSASRTHSVDVLCCAERSSLDPAGAIWLIWQVLKHLPSFVCLKDGLELCFLKKNLSVFESAAQAICVHLKACVFLQSREEQCERLYSISTPHEFLLPASKTSWRAENQSHMVAPVPCSVMSW